MHVDWLSLLHSVCNLGIWELSLRCACVMAEQNDKLHKNWGGGSRIKPAHNVFKSLRGEKGGIES